MQFVYGDRVHYTPAEGGDAVQVKVLGDRVMLGSVAMRRVEDPSGVAWTVREDELAFPDVQTVTPDDVSAPVTMAGLGCGCSWILQGHRAMGETAWCPSHAAHATIATAAQSYAV